MDMQHGLPCGASVAGGPKVNKAVAYVLVVVGRKSAGAQLARYKNLTFLPCAESQRLVYRIVYSKLVGHCILALRCYRCGLFRRHRSFVLCALR